jgi:hypothetical protein
MERGYIKINIEKGIVPDVEMQLADNNLWLSKYYPKQIVIQSTVFLDVENQEDMIFTL